MRLRILKFISNVLIYIYNPEKIKWYKDMLYSFRISTFFHSVGKGFYCERKIRTANPWRVDIGDNVFIYSNSIIAVHNINSQYGYISIGSNTIIGEYCHVTSVNQIVIGEGVLLGRRVTITDNSHGGISRDELEIPPHNRKLLSKGKCTIESNVWIGDNVVVLPGVTIGHNSIIGASSVVTRDIPPFSIAVGNPAQVKKTL